MAIQQEPKGVDQRSMNSSKTQHSNHAKAPKRPKKERLLQTNCHIGIIGSGLAGLSAALAIVLRGRSSEDDANSTSENNTNNTSSSNTTTIQNQHHPFQGRITIYERDAHQTDRKEGYGMTLTYDPNGPLAKLGLLEEVAKRDCPSRCHYLFNERGEIRGYFGNAFYSKGCSNNYSGQRGNLRIPRSELRSILMNALMSEAAAAGGGANSNDGCGNASPRVQILWKKRLLSYVDQPMMEELNQIHNGKKKKKKAQHCSNSDGDNAQPTQHKEQQRPVLLHFEDGTTDQVDLLIGADGVNSVVARQYLSTLTTTLALSKKKSGDDKIIDHGNVHDKIQSSTSVTVSTQARSMPSANSTEETTVPRDTGIFIILGISDHFHSLIDERGFHTLDGTHRLFIMPFQGSRLDDDTVSTATSPVPNQTEQTQLKQNQMTNKRSRRTMWQLSFPTSDRKEATRLSKLSQEEMQNEVLKRCGHWHAPFPAMVKETPLETIWGTSLLDRDPQIFLEHGKSLEIHGRIPSRVVVLGDAAHSMTPFKGQGANQAFADGPLLEKWLSSAKLDSAVRGFMREMTNRSGVKVRASREAAGKLHSKDCWDWMFQQDNKPAAINEGGGDVAAVFHGVQMRHVSTLLRILKQRGVGAYLGSKLDETIHGIIQELNIADTIPSIDSGPNQISSREMAHLQSQALEYASAGNMSQLRQMSRKSHLIIPSAFDADNKHTCLHLAAKHGHVDLCRWLLSEVNMSCDVLDANGKNPIDLAVDAGNEETLLLFKRWIDLMGQSCVNDGGVNNSTTSVKAVATATNTNNSNNGPSTNGGVKDDVYRHVEQQLRGIRTAKQLLTLLQKNRGISNDPKNNVHGITHVLGCHLDESDKEHDRQCMKVLAEEHGAVLLRNFIPREVDQLALGALALRPMNFDLSSALETLRTGVNDTSFDAIATIASKESMSKSERKRTSKRIEETKSQMTIPANANIIVQTNFGPEIQSYSALSENALKKRKIDSFPLSRLRYTNLGEWNYNWGDRQYEKVPSALVLPGRLVSLAQRAHEIAIQRTREDTIAAPVPFDMAICNLYHLQRPSDRLGGHQDNVESNLSLPLVTISLGAPGIFLLGGKSRNDVPTAILLRAGDCMIMSGRSRGYFHGLPTILSNELDDPGCAATDPVEISVTVFPELSDSGTPQENAGRNNDTMAEGIADIPSLDEMRFVKAFLTTVRMNMSIRQV